MRGSIQKKTGKDGKPVYYAVFAIGGKRKWVKAGPLKREAERLVREKITDLEQNGYRDLKKGTFQQLSEKWLVSLEASGLKPKTIDNYKGRLNANLIPAFGPMLLSNLNAEAIEAFKLDRESKVSAKTVNYDLLVLGMILKKAVHWRYLQRSPMEFVSKMKTRRKEFAALTKAQVGKLLEAAEKLPSVIPNQGKVLLTTAVFSGLRQGEILGMRWQHLDFKKGTYSVKESHGDFGFDVPKTQSSIRTIPLPQPLLLELKKHKIQQNKHRLRKGNWENHDLIFTTSIGAPITCSNLLHNIFYPARKEAKLPDSTRFHDLRGTAVTFALAAGATVKAAQTLLGHTTARLTLEVYAKSTQDGMDDLAKKLATYMK